MNKTQKAARIEAARAELAAAKVIQAAFATAFTNATGSEQWDSIQDAWNATHDMVRALEGVEHDIEMDDSFAQIVKSGEYESYKLAAANID